jgi:hypothetical protein
MTDRQRRVLQLIAAMPDAERVELVRIPAAGLMAEKISDLVGRSRAPAADAAPGASERSPDH